MSMTVRDFLLQRLSNWRIRRILSLSSVDFLCWSRFDVGACFCALLGGEQNGFWRITHEAQTNWLWRRYRSDPLVLEITFDIASGLIGTNPQVLRHLDVVNASLGLSGPVLQRGA